MQLFCRFYQQTMDDRKKMNLVTCTKEEFMAAFRKAKQQKREREEQLQREWAELQKRAAIESCKWWYPELTAILQYFDNEIMIFKDNKPQ